MNWNKSLIILFSLFAFTTCKKPNNRPCFKSIGDDSIQERSLDNFSAVVIENHIDLNLTEDSINWVTVESGENLINFITTEVVDDTLFIRDENNCGFLRDFGFKTVVNLSTSDLNYIKALGSGDIRTETAITKNLEICALSANGTIHMDLLCDSARIAINGGITDIKISGTNNYTYFYYFGNSNIDASNLISDKVLFNWQSTGELKTQVITSLVGEIGASGNVYYNGTPSFINVGLNGSGELIAQ